MVSFFFLPSRSSVVKISLIGMDFLWNRIILSKKIQYCDMLRQVVFVIGFWWWMSHYLVPSISTFMIEFQKWFSESPEISHDTNCCIWTYDRKWMDRLLGGSNSLTNRSAAIFWPRSIVFDILSEFTVIKGNKSRREVCSR